MSMDTHFFIFAGEKSGDLHGGHLMRALKQELKNVRISGVGGSEMKRQGLVSMLPMDEFSVMGFTDVLRSFPRLWKHFYSIRDAILKLNPQAVIFIDYPGFNLRMARALRKCGYRGKLIHYICPTVWAWGKERIQQMAQTLDLLLAIYPFEPQYFDHTSLNVQYVGNPLQESINSYSYHANWAKECGMETTENLIGIFPGSRKGEIERNLQKQLKTASLMLKSFSEATFAISCADNELLPSIKEIIEKSHLKLGQQIFIVPKNYSYELMQASRCAIAKSGTVTLELAYHECPTVVVYELSLLNRLIAQYILRLKLPYYCIVNILRDKSVFPELMAHEFSPENVYMQLKKLYPEGLPRKQCKEDCQEIKILLKEHSASERASKAILELLT